MARIDFFNLFWKEQKGKRRGWVWSLVWVWQKGPGFSLLASQAHHLATVVIRTVLVFTCAKARLFWQPAKKDYTVYVSLVKNRHDHFSTVQNKVGENHQVFLTGKLPGIVFISNLRVMGFFPSIVNINKNHNWRPCEIDSVSLRRDFTEFIRQRQVFVRKWLVHVVCK